MIEDKLYSLDSFKRQYEALLIVSVSDTIPDLIWANDKAELLKLIDWNNLLGIASALCQSSNSLHQDAALRIAQTCISQSCCNDVQKSAAAYILECLTNKPAIKIAVKRQLLNSQYSNSFSLQQKMEMSNIVFENSVIINSELLLLNKFQSAVYHTYEKNEAISISAPTSAGKSFVLCSILLDELLRGKKNIIYLVPTRALISQVESDLHSLVKHNNLDTTVSISTVPPIHNEIDIVKSNVFVFTQERLHWFLINNTENIPIQLIIVDEAHKIEDGNRGVLLQQKLEEIMILNPLIKVYFSSPFTSNPEILLEHLRPNIRKDKVNTQFVSVNQNLIYVEQVKRKIQMWHLTLVTIDKQFDLGQIQLKDRPTSEFKKMALIAEKIALNASSNIIYSNGAADAEKISMLLYNSVAIISPNDQLKELIKLIKHTIHKDYTLAIVLEKGIAFHYGNMPLLIRREIEKLFSEGVIRYLICTSTLLEGVNLPAKSIILKKPCRGKGKPLNANDFWNLAGRAGRWGKEFSGNIICVEPDSWEIKPNPNKSKQIIERAIDKIERNGNELISYIQNDSPRDIAESRQDLEFAFGYYYIKYIINREPYEQDDFYKQLIPILQNKSKYIQIPPNIIKRNPGISPIAQQQLFNYFSDRIDTIDECIPVYPNDENAFQEYIELVGRIGKTISDYPQMLNPSRSILLINWMTGKPLSYIIRESHRSYQNNPKYEKSKTLPVVIREVMENIEKFVRFRFAKDASCYIDILRYFLELHNKTDLLGNIPQLNLWLEFGVSEKTHLSLLALGLSRNTVIELSANYIINTQMGKDECLQWL